MRAPCAAQLANLGFASWLCFASGCVKASDQRPGAESGAQQEPGAPSSNAARASQASERAARLTEPPSRGPANAPIVIETYGDFECSYCAQGALLLRRLEQLYPQQLRIVWRHFPLEFHERALPAAHATLAAYEAGGHGAFWQMHDLLFVGHLSPRGPALSDADFMRFAEKVGVPSARPTSAPTNARHQARIADDIARGRALGISGTPSFVVNGHVIEGIVPLEAFRHAIDALLRQRQERLRHAI